RREPGRRVHHRPNVPRAPRLEWRSARAARRPHPDRSIPVSHCGAGTMNIFGHSSLSRRRAIGAAAGLAGLPLLEALAPRRAHAQAAAYPRRFVVFFSANGTILDDWAPTGGETDFQLSPILAPLEPHRSDIVVIRGVDQRGGGGVGHQNGIG